jgi:glycosyltransferase involved in cell wall biosynthesis
MKLVLHAPNVHQGGGKTLLLSLLGAFDKSESATVLIDDRLGLPGLPENIRVVRFPPTVVGRISAERFLKAHAEPADTVLCLGNLPPLLRLRARRTVLFLQNRYLLDAVSTSEFTLRVRLRNSIERYWLRARVRNVQLVVVQTASMADATHRSLGINPAIAPFAVTHVKPAPGIDEVRRQGATTAVFLYVASGEQHKNHRRLVEAWTLLANAGIRPLLRLTLNPTRHSTLTTSIDARRKQFGLHIENVGEVDTTRLAQIYDEATALIYPSLTESLGLPLLEARAHGLPVIASERDFVRDVVIPHETFDPESALSIARAVRRFLRLPEPTLEIKTPGEFLDLVLK